MQTPKEKKLQKEKNAGIKVQKNSGSVDRSGLKVVGGRLALNGVGELTAGQRQTDDNGGGERHQKMGTKEDRTGDRDAFILLSSSSGHLYFWWSVFFSSVFLYFCIFFSIVFSDSCIFVLFCIFFERVVTSVFLYVEDIWKTLPRGGSGKMTRRFSRGEWECYCLLAC